jgi:hypothetical protein
VVRTFLLIIFHLFLKFYLLVLLVAGSNKKVWQANTHVHQNFGYDWFEAFSNEPNEGTSLFCYFPSLESQMQLQVFEAVCILVNNMKHCTL